MHLRAQVSASSHKQGVGRLHSEHSAMVLCVGFLQRHNKSLLPKKTIVAAVLQPVLVIHTHLLLSLGAVVASSYMQGLQPG